MTARIRDRWRAWRCHRDHHAWTRAHAAIWGGGYMRCDHCGRREVHGPDQYGPAALAWTARGIAPPADGWAFDAVEWAAWNLQVRQGQS